MAEHQLSTNRPGRQEPGSLRFVKGLDQRVLVRPGDLADDLGGERSARYGSRYQHLAGGHGQAVQPLAEDEPDALRHGDLVHSQV